MKKKQEIYISHVLFPWESFSAQGEREKREKANNGARWTSEFIKEVRKNILRFSAMEDCALRNSNLNDTYNLVPLHFRNELFAGISFPRWN